MTILALPNTRAQDRFGIIASRKLGGAVVRNRAKRRLRSIFRQARLEQDGRSGPPGLDLVAIPRRELLTASFDLLAADFQSAVRRLRTTR
jgi:ribonuclease P protein component